MRDQDLKQEARQRRQAMLEGARRRLNARRGGRSIVKYISAEVDALLLDLWARIAGPSYDYPIDIVAVGGYGRAELCPYSDWDLLFLVPKAADRKAHEPVERLMQVLWDSGAQIGQAVRTPAETLQHAEDDHHARTALLESRLLTGTGELYAKVKKGGQQHWSRRQRIEFCTRKIEECAQRRREMGDTAFLMEPDVKSGKGALRDVSTVFWLSMAWYGVPTARELIGRGVVSEAEFNGFVRGRGYLWRVRIALHLLAGREEDRLRFEYQPQLAARFGFRHSDKMKAVERFMKRYFLHVRTIADLSDIFLLHFEEQMHPPRPWRRLSRKLGGGMIVRDSKVSIGAPGDFAADPLNLLRIFVEAQKEHRYLDSRALRVIRNNAALITADVRSSDAANDLFLEILRSPRNVATVLRQMHETDVLGRFVPDFGRIISHGQFDRYHSYTVDTHTIRAIDILRDFRLGEGQFIEMPLAAHLMPQVQRPELLYIALLFHDIAKGRGTDHSALGAQLARRFCRRLRLSRDDTELVAWLVRHHLTLSRTAQHYDLSDPEVIADFSRFVGDRERLIALFLLTVADVTAVGPNVWTDWKGTLLTHLFEATEACLLGGHVTPADQEHRLADRRESVLAMCAPAERERIGAVLGVLSNTCMLHFPPVPLLRLCRMLAVDYAGTDVTIRTSLGYTQLLAWGDDRPELFARLTAALSGANVKILTAHAYALRDGRILDEFHFTDEQNQPITEEHRIQRLRQRVQHVLDGGKPPPVTRAAEPDVLMRALPVHVRRLEAAARRITAIEVFAADRTGLLADLAAAIAELDIDLRGANISTFGEKAVDVFFMTDRRGNKLSEDQIEQVIARLHAAAELPAAGEN